VKQEIAVGLNKETADLLRDLASKIGVTVDHLWGVLVKQAPIYGWTILSLGIPLLFGWIFWFRWLGWLERTINSKKEKHQYYESDPHYVGAVVSAILLVTGTLIWVFNLPTVFGCLFNPEYWALKQIWK